MKLHLPKPLRNSVLACIAAVAGIATPTLGTATFAGGVVAFTLASQQAMADTVSVTTEQLIGAVKTDSVTGITVGNNGVLTFADAQGGSVVGVVLTDGLVINSGGSVIVEGNSSSDGFVNGSSPVTINAGGTLTLTGVDALGYSQNGSSQVQSITLAGEEGNTANLVVNKRQTLSTSLSLGGHTNVTIGEDGITAANDRNRGGFDLFFYQDQDTSIPCTLTVNGADNVFDVYIQDTRNCGLALALGANAEITFSRSIQTTGGIQLADGAGSSVVYTADVNANYLYAKMANVTFGDGTNACTATFTRIELGDSGGSGSHSVSVGANSKLVVTGNNNGTSYKQASLLIGEWEAQTNVNVAGTLMAQNAKMLTGDAGGSLNIQGGGTVVLKGIGVADVSKTGKSQSLALSMASDSKLLLGVNGIDMSGRAFTTDIQGGTIGMWADLVYVNQSLSVNGALTIDTSKYSIDAQNVTVTRGTESGNMFLMGNITGEGSVTVTGSGTLNLSDVLVGVDILVNEGSIALHGSTAMNNDATITIGENAVLKKGVDISETQNWGSAGDDVRLAYKAAAPSMTLPAGVINNGSTEISNTIVGKGTVSDTTVTFLDKSLQLEEVILAGGKYALWEQDVASVTSEFLKQAGKITLDGAGFLALSSYFNNGQSFSYSGLNFDIELAEAGGYFVAYGDAVADFSGSISGNGTITKNDTGKVILSGDMGSFTGAIVVNGGELVIGKAVTLASVSIADGATLTAGEGITFANNLQLAGNRTINFGASSILSGSLVTVQGNNNTVTGKVTGASTALRQTTSGTLTISGESTVVTVDRYVGSDGSGANTTLTIDGGATLNINRANWNTDPNSAGFMLGHWGATSVVNILDGSLNAVKTGISVKDGNGTINVGENGILNIKALAAATKERITVNLNGGMINIGELGISHNSVAGANTDFDLTLNLNGGTLGILSTVSSWQTWKQLELQGDITINTDCYQAASDGTHGAYTGKGGVITLNAGVTGDHLLTKAGAGTLVLGSVENLAITGGYVKALSGGLTIGASLAAMTADGGRFLYSDFSNGTSDRVIAKSYAGPLFLTLENVEAGTYYLFEGSNALSADKVDVQLFAARGLSATVGVDNGLVKVIVSGTADTSNYDLVWNTEHLNNVWTNSNAENWYTAGTTTANRFSTGDNVTFAGVGETISLSSNITAGDITVTGTGYVLSGDATLTATALNLAENASLKVATKVGSDLGNITLAAGSTLDLAVASTTNLASAIGDHGAITVNGAATIKVSAGSYTWARDISGDSASVAMVVDKGATLTFNASSSKYTSLTVEKGGTLVMNNSGQNPRTVGTITVRGQLNTTGDAFGWGNPSEGNRLTQLMIDEGVWKMTGANNTFSNLPVVLNKGVIEMGTSSGGWDFFSNNAEGNLVKTEATAKGQSVIRLAEGSASDMTSGTNKIGARRNLLTFDIARATVHTGTDTSDLLVDVGLYRKDDQSGTARRAMVKKGDGIMELTAGFVNDLDVDLTAGTLRLSDSAKLANGTLAMTAGSTLDLNLAGTAASTGAITGAGTIVKRNSGNVSLSGLASNWTGAIKLQQGTLGMGETLAIGAGRSLEAAAGTTLDSALTLSGGSLVLGSATQVWDAETGMSLGGHALTLDSTNKTQLTLHLAEADKAMNSAITLFTDTSITLNEGDTLGTYFSSLQSELSHAILSVVNGSLIATIAPENKLEWAPATDSVWMDGGAFGNGTYVSDDKPNLLFGAVSGTEVVTVTGAVAAREVVITPGAGSVYEFDSATDADKITTADIVLESGTLALAAGVLGDDVTISMLDGTTLQWGTTAEASAAEDYSGQLTVNGNVTLDAGSNSVTLSNDISGLSADSTTTLKGNFTLNDDTVLKGTVNIDGGTVTLVGLGDNQDDYNQNFTGSGRLAIDGGDKVQLTGTNNYAGDTVLNSGCVLQIDALSAYSAASTMTGAGALKLNAVGEYAWNHDSDMTGTVTIASGATVKLTQALSTAFAGAGALNITGGTAETPIEWDATGKSYTGQTQLAAGAYVTTAGSLTSGQNSKIVLGEGSQLTITGGLDSWTSGHTVSGTGTLVLSTGVTHTNAANKLLASGATLSNLVLRGSGTALEFGSSNGQVVPFNAASTVTIEDGASLIMNANFGDARNTVTLNGDGTGEDGSAALCFSTHPWTDGNVHETKLASAIVLGSDSEVYVGAHTNAADNASIADTGTISGTMTGNGHTLTKTGAGTLKVTGATSNAKVISTAGITILEGVTTGYDYTVNAGTLRVNVDRLTSAPNGMNKLTIQGGKLQTLNANTDNCSSDTSVNLYTGATLDLWFGAAKTWTITGGFAVSDASADDANTVAYIESPRANTLVLDTAVTGSSAVELINPSSNNNTSATAKATLSLRQDNSGYTGTWNANGNWKVAADHTDALKNATVALSADNAELVLGVDSVNLTKLTGTTGTVTGSGKTLNIANSETTGVEYSGAIGEGVTIQVSEGYQKITGAGKTGNVTLATLRSTVDASEDPEYGEQIPEEGELGGGALLLSETEAPVAPVLNLEGYAHSTDANAGVTTILAGNKGSIQNLVLGQNMLLTTQVADAVVSMASLANIGADLTLSGGKVKFHLNGSTASEGEAFNAEVMTQYDLAGNNLILGEGTVTALTFVPEAESGKLQSKRTYQLFTNVGNLDALVDDWAATDDTTIFTSAKLAAFFNTNFSENGRTSYKFAKEVWPVGGTHLSLLVEGGAADLVWNVTNGTWDTGVPGATEMKKPWLNNSTADYFMDDDNVVFNAQKGTDAYTITIDDEDGVRIGSMKVTGDADYVFAGDGITSGEGLGNVHIGTTGTDGVAYIGTVTFENSNSWKGNTNINSGDVVAKTAAALSNTNVNLNGGSLTVDGVALDATVKMLGGNLVATGSSAGATVDLSAAGMDMNVSAATDSTLSLDIKGTEEVAGIIGGNVTINGEVDSEGNPVTGSVALGDATVVSGGSLTVGAGDVTAGALVLQGAKTEGDTTTEGAVKVKGGSLSAASLANAGGVTVDGASMSITGAVDNDGILTVTNGSLSMGALDNDGTLTIGGTEMKDVQLGETTVSVPVSSVVVNGDLNNENGTIIIGSDATYGSLKVTGDLTGTGAKEKLVVEAGSSLTVEGDLTAVENVELGIGGTVTVGGNVGISKLTIAENALLHATGADTETAVEIGTLTGAGTVKVDNGTLHIGALSGFIGTLAGNGTLSTEEVFLLETKQDTTTNITGGSVKVNTDANGSSVGLVTTNEIIIDTMTTDAPSLSMTGIELKGSDAATIENLTITLTQMGSNTGVDGIIQAVDAADGGIDYYLLSIDGKQSLDLFQLAENEAVHQYLLQKGYAHSDLLSAATFAAASSTDVYISFWKQSSEESTWNVGDTSTVAGLKVLQDGKLLSNDVLANVQNVVVSGTKSIDLTAADVNDVVLNKLVGTSASKLTVKGDNDKLEIKESSYEGTLVLECVDADLTLTGTDVVAADAITTLSGKLTNGTLTVMQDTTAQGDGLTLTNSAVQVAIDKDFTTLTKSELDKMGGVIAKLGNVTIEGSSTVAVGTYNSDTGVLTDSVGYNKYFDMSSARVEGGKVVADRNTSYYTSKLADSASSGNGKVGLAMADEVLVNANPQGDTVTGDLAAVLDQLDTMVATGNKAGADKLGASLAGASTAVLGMAAMGDVDRQLRAIRNRTTTMGVDQSVVNADMPYFNAWINAEGDSREMGKDETLGGYKLNSYGGTVGFDVDIEPTLTAGMALTAMYGDLDATGADQATGNLDSYYVSAFARYCGSAWTHTFVGTIGMGDISLDRTVAGAQVKGETDSMSFGLMYEVGRVYALDEDGTTCLQPVFNVTWKHTTVDAYTEKGGDVALSVDEQSLDTITFGLGARLQAVVGESMYNRTSIFECRLLAKADAGDTEGTSKVALGSSATHEVKSNEMGAIGIEIGAGLTIPLGDEGSSIFMDASAEIRSDYTDVNGTVGYRVNF